MKFIIIPLLFSLAIVGTYASPVPQEKISEVITDSKLSGSLIVTRRGETVFSGSYGMANVEHNVPNTLQTKFRIGSISKQFTAMAVFILSDNDLLDIENPIGSYIEGLPESWNGLTIRQLLTHTSGLMHPLARPEFLEEMSIAATIDETLEKFYDEPLLFEPGSDFNYSGVGYSLLAKLIEEVSGLEYGEYLKEEIFHPLHMFDSGVDHPKYILKNRASSYLRRIDGGLDNAPYIFMPSVSGGGSLYSSVLDMQKWNTALDIKRLISPKSYEKLYKPDLKDYACGWVTRKIKGRDALFHSGYAPAFRSYNLRFPNEEISIVILANVDPVKVGLLAEAIAEIMFKSIE